MIQWVANIILAIVQGLSEWFPISSSGHLVLFSYLLGVESYIQLDVALHFGTLMAVFVYFGKDISDILEDILKGRWKSQNAKMGFLLVLSAIPAALMGVFFKKYIESAFNSMLIVSIGFGITSMFLFISSLNLRKKKEDISYKDSFLIGLAQAFAILPGVSRSGSTIGSGLLLGLEEKTAVRFSFLMSIPVIFGAGILELGSNQLSPDFILPTLIAFAIGLATIHLLLKIIVNSKKNLRWFAIYCLLLAIGIMIYLALN
jgi:undecaprenyl-diphosphatase